MVRPRTRLAPTHRHAQRALLRYRHRMLNRPVQRLWLERDQVRERYGAQLDGYVQDARDLGRQLTARLGDAHVAHLALASGRVRPVGLWHRAWFTVYRPCLVSYI